MPEGPNVREVGDRIERLLEEIRGMASPPVWQRVEELMRSVVDLYGTGLRRMVDIIAEPGRSSEEIATLLLDDRLVESLFLLHGLHPDDFSTRVEKALDRVKPYLGSHGGDVVLLSADDATGAVKLRLGGSCDGCPSSLLTVKMAVEGAIRELAPEAASIEVEGVVGMEPKHANGAANAHSWFTLDVPAHLHSGSHSPKQLDGTGVLLCRLGDKLYAYRDTCPSCRSAIDVPGELSGDLLTCPSCAERYDVRLAGRSIRRRELHLDPLPLLEDEHGVRVALGAAS